jgi:hypothetical protein
MRLSLRAKVATGAVTAMYQANDKGRAGRPGSERSDARGLGHRIVGEGAALALEGSASRQVIIDTPQAERCGISPQNNDLDIALRWREPGVDLNHNERCRIDTLRFWLPS